VVFVVRILPVVAVRGVVGRGAAEGGAAEVARFRTRSNAVERIRLRSRFFAADADLRFVKIICRQLTE
jgi:hypothetical protein